MTPNKGSEAGKGSESAIPPEEEASIARERSETLEREADYSRTQSRRASAAASRLDRVADDLEGKGRFRRAAEKMGFLGVSATCLAVGAALGVGGTVILNRRMNRTAVNTSMDMPVETSLDQM
jgi:hypothetical protein